MLDLTAILAADPAVRDLAAALDARKHAVATGAVGSSTPFVAAAVARLTGRPTLLLLAHIDDADEAHDELTAAAVPVLRLPALEVLPGESGVSLDLFAERLAAVRAILSLDSKSPVILAPIQSLMQGVPAPSRLDSLARTLTRDQSINLNALTHWLDSAGYKRVDAVEEPGDFALRGGILDIFPPGSGAAPAAGASATGVPVRLDFFGDQIERITEVDLETMGSDRAVESVYLVAAELKSVQTDKDTINFLELLPPTTLGLIHETLEVVEQARGYYERVTDARGLYGPPAVLKLLEERAHAIAEINQFSAGGTTADTRIELPVGALPAFAQDAAEAIKELAALTTEQDQARRVIVCCQNTGEKQRLGELLTENAPEAAARIEATEQYLHRGFIWDPASSSSTTPLRHSATPPLPLTLVPYHELLNRFTTRRRATRLRSSRAMDTFLDFAPGDYVVHTEHGIARFVSLSLMKPRELPGSRAPTLPSATDLPSLGKTKRPPSSARLSPPRPAGEMSRVAETERVPLVEQEEYLTLEFAGGTKLHVPASKIDQVQKYVGGFAGKPPLSTLGGQRWQSQKARTAESVKDLAAEMLRVRAAREHMPGIRYPGDTPWQNEFEAEFPYEETEDQNAAMAEIKKDMLSPRPMDRLVCGDVGFGKTELAIRAAFKACEFGKQVAVLVPTTVLAEQHERTFKGRFAGYPFRVESLSRFKTDAELKKVLQDLKKGHVDLIIGTHRLLSQDVHFADLGLVVVDEEQRFGVEHKETLLRLRLTVDVLTLSATPIPRTLHMAMLGIRDISSLTTAPLDRRAIVTEVIPYNERRVAQAIARELSRDGQVYFVHNRVYDIQSVADSVQKLAPDARIVVGHGQMNPHELEEVMLKFMRRQADVLVSTTIIESGIDIPTANTMFINDADRFGLADLHQLRGRVGRSKHRAYCYMLLPADRNVREIAQKRLKAIEQYSMLGAGFKIAMRDLEIRGAGNLLGAEQSGHIAAVGYEMYCHLLEDAVHNLKNERPPAQPSSTSIEIGITGTIPKPYIPSDARRLEAYRRIATATTPDSLKQVEADLTAAYGTPPRPAQRLLEMAAIRIAAASLDVRTITVRDKDVIFRTPNPKGVEARLKGEDGVAGVGIDWKVDATVARPGTVTALPPKSTADLAEVYFRPPEAYMKDAETLVAVLRKRLGA